MGMMGKSFRCRFLQETTIDLETWAQVSIPLLRILSRASATFDRHFDPALRLKATLQLEGGCRQSLADQYEAVLQLCMWKASVCGVNPRGATSGHSLMRKRPLGYLFLARLGCDCRVTHGFWIIFWQPPGLVICELAHPAPPLVQRGW